MRLAALALGALTMAACYTQGATPATAQATQVTPVQWNVSSTDTGHVVAVAETGVAVVVYGDKGAQIFAGGALATVDSTVTAWQPAATVIPAADGTAPWLVALSADGRVMRLRGGQALEDVSDRYGLLGAHVTGVANGAGSYAVFSSDLGLSIADGVNVVAVPGALTGLVAAQHRAAGLTADGKVRIVDLATLGATDYVADHAVAVAFDAAGLLWVETDHKLYRETKGALDLVYEDGASVFHGLAFGGGRLWFAAGADLGFATQDVVMRGGAALTPDAQIFGSPTGDVWVVSQGAVARFGVPVSGDEANWRTTVLPVYARVCSQCHGPSGSSGIDMSTYASWASRRQSVYDRVFVQKTMPQNQTLTADDAAAILAWTKATP